MPEKVRKILHFFPLLALASVFFCCIGEPGDSALSPSPTPPDFSLGQTGEAVELEISLRVAEGQSPGVLLAAARDDTTSDSLNLYIDVTVENVGPEVVLLPEEADTLKVMARVSFVDVPYKKFFNRGRVKVVLGQTYTGLQVSEYYQADFDKDTPLLFAVPITRIDSFQVADNVAVYGQELAADRYIIASRVKALPGQVKASDYSSAALLGWVRSVDEDKSRLYVSDATVVITDSTRVESSSGVFLSLGMLRSGSNELTITVLADALNIEGQRIANGWELKRFAVCVARPPK